MPHDDQVSVPGVKKIKCDFDFSQAGTDNIDDLESWNEDEGVSLDSIRATKDQLSLVGERMKWWRVFAMHFLFTWNVRTYEYASVSAILPSQVELPLKIARLSWYLWHFRIPCSLRHCVVSRLLPPPCFMHPL
jgi:hypothetical protein